MLLAGEQTGDGPAIVLLHGLTGTRRYVVMGSRALERSGLRAVAFDARGHGRSAPAPDPSAYGYARLARDLLALLDALEIERAVLAGVSMGAHTLARFALDHPARVAALGLITPAYDPATGAREPGGLAGWDALARGLREGGVEGFASALRPGRGPGALARDRRDGAAPAAGRARAPIRGRRRARSRAALAPVRANRRARSGSRRRRS